MRWAATTNSKTVWRYVTTCAFWIFPGFDKESAPRLRMRCSVFLSVSLLSLISGKPAGVACKHHAHMSAKLTSEAIRSIRYASTGAAKSVFLWLFWLCGAVGRAARSMHVSCGKWFGQFVTCWIISAARLSRSLRAMLKTAARCALSCLTHTERFGSVPARPNPACCSGRLRVR